MPNDDEINEELTEEEQTLENQTNNIEEPVENSPASVGSSIKNVAVDVAKNKAKDFIKKKLAVTLLANPIFWICLLVIIVVLIIIILIFALDFDIGGSRDTTPTLYTTNCSKIYVAWENEEYTEEHKFIKYSTF